MIRLLFGSALLISLLGLSPWPWWMEFFGHARPTYLLGLLVLLPLARERVALLLWGLSLLVNLALVAPLYWGGGRGPASLKLISCNVLGSNPNHSRVLELLRQEKPDVVALQEVRSGLLADLAPILADYQGQLLAPREDNFGMALLSRGPLRNTRVEEGLCPYMLADTTVRGQSLHLLSVHPVPPVAAQYAQLRNTQISQFSSHLAERNDAFVLLGDMNETPWAPSLAPLRAVAVSARSGFGCLSSWPTSLPFFLRIPIDHCFVSPGIKVVDCRLGPETGSDHLPLVVSLSLP